MEKAQNRRHVEQVFREAFKNDKARSQMARLSKFGIIEMTRQRVQPSLERTTYIDCPYCKGAGIIKSSESMALEIIRHLKLLAGRDQIARVQVTLHPKVAQYINNEKRDALTRLEDSHRWSIRLVGDADTGIDHAAYRCYDGQGREMRVEGHTDSD